MAADAFSEASHPERIYQIYTTINRYIDAINVDLRFSHKTNKNTTGARHVPHRLRVLPVKDGAPSLRPGPGETPDIGVSRSKDSDYIMGVRPSFRTVEEGARGACLALQTSELGGLLTPHRRLNLG